MMIKILKKPRMMIIKRNQERSNIVREKMIIILLKRKQK